MRHALGKFSTPFRTLVMLVLACCLGAQAFAQQSPQRPRNPRQQQAQQQRVTWEPGAEVRSKHYRILSDLEPDDTKLYGGHLDLLYEEYSRRLASLPPRAPEIPFVLMFARESDYLAVLRTRYGVNATGSGGMFFISPQGAALAFFTEGLPRSRVFHVIQHEGFHQFAHSRFVGSLPPWLNEGLAEYFGEAIVVEGRVIIGQSSAGPVQRIKKAIEQNETIDFLRMLTMTSDEWNANVRAGNAGVQYMQAWSMVQYLSWADKGRYQRAFEGYIQLLHAGTPSDRAFVQAFGTNDLKNFEEAWKTWARNAVPSSLGTAAMKLTFLAEGMVQLSHDGVKVNDLEDLVTKLRERNFKTEVSVHGRTETMEANERTLEIPKDELTAAQPVFDFIAPKTKGIGAVEKKREEEHPTPLTITTRGLEPRELVLKWTRRKSGDFDYEILSPNKAPAPAKPERRAPAKEEPAKTP